MNAIARMLRTSMRKQVLRACVWMLSLMLCGENIFKLDISFESAMLACLLFSAFIGAAEYGRPSVQATATCLPGIMGGGDLALVNLTLPAATSFCNNSTRCAGFTSENPPGGGPFPNACNGTTVVRAFHFKDHYGAIRRAGNAEWSSWLISKSPTPPPPSPIPPVVVGVGHEDTAGGLSTAVVVHCQPTHPTTSGFR